MDQFLYANSGSTANLTGLQYILDLKFHVVVHFFKSLIWVGD